MTHITSTIEPNHGVGCIIGSFPDTKQKEPKVHDSHQRIKIRTQKHIINEKEKHCA